MNIAHKSLEKLLKLIENGDYTSQEIYTYFLDRSKTLDSEIGSLNSISESAFSNSNKELKGLPIGVKDIFCEAGVPTTASSKILENFTPPYSSTIIEKLKEAGASFIAKCNMDEFAMGSSGENSAFKDTKNPHDLSRIPGGSSSGSAASVAAGLVPAALGTDTGGSIRQPASMCGVVGFKPSYGRNSRFGVMPMASSLDTPGTITKTVYDAALLYNIMNGEDERESSSLPETDHIDLEALRSSDMKGVKVGVPKEYFEEGLDAGVREQIQKTIKVVEELGAEVVDISLPMTKYAVAAYYIICPAEVSTNLARLDGIRYGRNSETPNQGLEDIYLHNRGEGLGPEPQRRSIIGSYVLSAGFYDAYFKKAAQVRTKIIDDFEEAFNSVDIILGPVAPSVAWKIGEQIDDPLQMYLEDAYTIPASLAGLPGLSLPCGFASPKDDSNIKLPVGIQILSKRKNESGLLAFASCLERKLDLGEAMIPKKFAE